ncbi:MAG: hypothetical protein ACFFD9_10965, partial [Candidatus Thorarchaeota archaeon]
TLRNLGFRPGGDRESREMTLLRTLLRMQNETSKHFSFSEIYHALQEHAPEAQLKKPWMHKALKSLEEKQFIRLESQESYRKRYIADVNTVMTGLEKLKEERVSELEKEMTIVKDKLRLLAECECGELARDFVTALTGESHTPSSRFIRGMDEFHRVTNSTIYERAEKNDVIRSIAIWVGAFGRESPQRFMRVFEAAKRGVEVRYGLHPDILVMGSVLKEDVSTGWLTNATRELVSCKQQGLNIDVRIQNVDRRGYQFVSLNDEVMAFFITESPITAAWITRSFNPDLIDNAIATFDEAWEKSKSVLNLTPDDIKTFGAKPEDYLPSAVSRALLENSDQAGDG